MSISNSALIFYHTYTIESKKKSVYFTDFSIKTSFSLEYRDRFERLLGFYMFTDPYVLSKVRTPDKYEAVAKNIQCFIEALP